MKQVDPLVLCHKHLGLIYARFDQMPIDHQEDQKQF